MSARHLLVMPAGCFIARPTNATFAREVEHRTALSDAVLAQESAAQIARSRGLTAQDLHAPPVAATSSSSECAREKLVSAGRPWAC